MKPTLLFAALGDETRCALIEMLRERPRPVHELAIAFPISRPAISRHLRVLKQAGLVAEERNGRENVYVLKRQKLRSLSLWLDQRWSGAFGKAAKAGDEAPPAMQAELDF